MQRQPVRNDDIAGLADELGHIATATQDLLTPFIPKRVVGLGFGRVLFDGRSDSHAVGTSAQAYSGPPRETTFEVFAVEDRDAALARFEELRTEVSI